jgi:hypothetical protein
MFDKVLRLPFQEGDLYASVWPPEDGLRHMLAPAPCRPLKKRVQRQKAQTMS